MIRKVVLTTRAKKDLRGLPGQIVQKFATWTGLVETVGLEEARKVKGFHDEPLKGDRKGQRSVRLNRSYRAIYLIVMDEVQFAEAKR